MRQLNWLAAALAAALVAAGCAAKAPAVDTAAEAEAVRERSAEWLRLAQAKDAAAIAGGIYTSDAVTMFDGQIRKGAAEIQAGMEAETAAMPNSTISWTTSDVRVASSGDMAWETGSWTFDPDGDGAQPAINGEFITVWTKVDGTWRAVADAGTSPKTEEPAAPEAETAA
ncbi:MAG TPA: nuclear transport factor 2 family protein [Steroidobacteraceae bacterium]|nr:nuclear transport factor 2 family protein [Steroidobacteraceae bacterium]